MNRSSWSDGYGASNQRSGELFSRGTLELTFAVLRKPYPALALAIQNTLTLAYPRHDYHIGLHGRDLPMTTDTIDRVALALSALSHRSASGRGSHGDLALLRSLLLDWLMLARSRGDIDSSALDGPAHSA